MTTIQSRMVIRGTKEFITMASWAVSMGWLSSGGVVYYIQHATAFWGAVLGIFKALFWPAVLMYKLLELLKM